MRASPLFATHQKKQAVFSPCGEGTIPAHFGDVRQEYEHVRRQAGLIDLSHWSLLSLRGPDRKEFLHGMVTNDVKSLPLHHGNYSLMLTKQGKIIAEAWVIQRQEDLLLISRGENSHEIDQNLDKYHIMEDLEIYTYEQEFALLALQGPKAREIMRHGFRDGELPANDGGYQCSAFQGVPVGLFQASCSGEQGFFLLVESRQAEALGNLLRDHGAQPVGLQALDRLRIETGIPVWGRELDESVIPQEACLYHALDFYKGCYIGQEVVARLQYRGHVNRELTGFLLPEKVECEEEITLHAEGKTVGKITSVCESPRLGQIVGLGYLRCKVREEGKEIEAQCGEQAFRVQVAALPLVETPHSPMMFTTEKNR